MSENDFYLLNGNQYRGSRYANFAGGGVDQQGNVSSAINESATNSAATYSDRGQQPAGGAQPSPGLIGAASLFKPEAIKLPSIQGAVKDLVIGAALPSAGKTIGSAVGSSLAGGASYGTAFGEGASALANKVSGGLMGGTSGLGAGASATNAALKGMGGKFGPATASSVGGGAGATGGASLGAAAGTGLGAAAATLLTGGSFKDAAKSGIGSAVGYAIGHAILPGVGGFIGSTLGSMAAGMIGGGVGRQTIGANFGAGGKVNKVSTKDYSMKKANKFAGYVSTALADIEKNSGGVFRGATISTNVGSKDRGTRVDKFKVSGKAGDLDAIINYIQSKPDYYFPKATAQPLTA